jgi:MinD-like ATPase involved in chromosome partitioning or flagellar assembly
MSITSVWGPSQSGKTTLAIDLSHAFSQHGKSVCLISPEPFSELTARMNIRITRAKSIAQAYETPGNLKQVVLEAVDLLYVLAASWDTDAFDEEPGTTAVKELLRQAENTFDCVIVDCSAGNGNVVSARALNLAGKVILLSGGSGVSAMWHGAYKRPIAALADKTVCVCNHVVGSYDYLGLCKLIRQNPEVFLPYYPDIASIQTMKRTLYGSASKPGREYTENLDKLMDKLEVTAQ